MGRGNCACNDQDGSLDTDVDDEGGGTDGSKDDDDLKNDEVSTTFIFLLTVTAGASNGRGISD